MKKSNKIGNWMLVASIIILAVLSFACSEVNSDSLTIFIMLIIFAIFFLSGLFFKVRAVIKEKDHWRNMFL